MVCGHKVELYPLSLEELIQFSNRSYESFPFDMTDFKPDQAMALAIEKKIEKMQLQPVELSQYMTYHVIIENQLNKGIGLIGFKGIERDQSMEVGYGVCEKYEGQGYASAALNRIVQWVQDQGMYHTITAKRVLKSNIGSQKVLEKNGFSIIDQTDIDYTYALNLKCGGNHE